MTTNEHERFSLIVIQPTNDVSGGRMPVLPPPTTNQPMPVYAPPLYNSPKLQTSTNGGYISPHLP
ncbi:MAG TPA: hypothetical protein VF607_13675 [Verrucomicrobiae bacterium]